MIVVKSIVRELVLVGSLSLIIMSCGEKKAGKITGDPDNSAALDSVKKPKVTEDDLDYLDSLVTSPQQAQKAMNDTLKADFKGTVGVMDKKSVSAGMSVLKGVRTGTHAGFDRIVFEFSGESLPGYHLEYIDKPIRQCGSGNPVRMAGDAWLQVQFTPAQAHTDAGKPTVANRSFTTTYPNMIDVKSTCDFEGEVAWVLGVKSPKQYRVLELLNPTRVVVDVKQ